MKYTQNCECCGHIKVAYAHKLNRQIIQALQQLTDQYLKTRRPVNLQKELSLSKNQYNNFQKLQYFKLVIRDEKGWIPTRLAYDFVSGKTQIPDTAGTFGKEILGPLHEAWKTHNVSVNVVFIHDLDPLWKKREDYQQEKCNTLF